MQVLECMCGHCSAVFKLSLSLSLSLSLTLSLTLSHSLSHARTIARPPLVALLSGVVLDLVLLPLMLPLARHYMAASAHGLLASASLTHPTDVHFPRTHFALCTRQRG